MLDFIRLLNSFIWDYILIVLLIGAGAYFTIRTRFIQFRFFAHSLKLILSSRRVPHIDKKIIRISSFQAFCTGLAARVGTGNLAGVAIAIYLGGPGAIFWMWIIALIGMATAFVESTLGQVYKIRNPDGSFRGGPAYYIERGLGQRWLGILFALLLISTFGLTFNAVQANTISAALNNAFFIEPFWIGLFITVGAAIIIFGGAQRIFHFSEFVVPFMAIFFLLITTFVVVKNFDQLPSALALIVKSAFGIHEAAAGGIAYTINQALMNGVKRGLFSNEAGMGSVPNAAAVASPSPEHPAVQGLIQMLGVFVDTLVICTATAAIIILSGISGTNTEATGIVLMQMALSIHVGNWSIFFVAILVLLFAFTSLVANYYYGESNIRYISNNKTFLFSYRIIVLAVIMFGSIGSLPIVWNLADLTMALMAIINLIAILLLSKGAMQVLKDYEMDKQQGILPKFTRDKCREFAQKISEDVW